MSFFDEVETTVANTRLLQAVEENAPIKLDLALYEELAELDRKLRERLTLPRLLKSNTIGNYQFSRFLADTGSLEALKFMEMYKLFEIADPDKTFEAAALIYEEFFAHHTKPAVKERGESKLEQSEDSKTQIQSSTKTESPKISGSGWLAFHILERFPDVLKPLEAALTGAAGPSGEGASQPSGGASGGAEANASAEQTQTQTQTQSQAPQVQPQAQAQAQAQAQGEGEGGANEGKDAPASGTSNPSSSTASSSSSSTSTSISTSSSASSSSLTHEAHGRRVVSKAAFEPLVIAVEELLTEKMAQFDGTEHWRRYIQVEHYARQPVKLADFRVFRVLGRGAFGAVSAVQKVDTHAIFAMKEMGKKQVKATQSMWMVVNEKKVLSCMQSPFVLNLKYSFHNEDSLYLILDMCSGGDLKFHLRSVQTQTNSRPGFEPERARFYAAEVLLGLEHIHSFDIVYRDLKPNNILLDNDGHAKISDLGLAIKLRKNKVLKHLAGTAGYWAPEVLSKTGTYKTSDFWSFGVFLYEMLAGRRPDCACGRKTKEWCPFGQKPEMERNALEEDAQANLTLKVTYPSTLFSPQAVDLLQKLFNPDPLTRLGAHSPDEIKNHPYFAGVDWGKLMRLQVKPPWVPDSRTVNANSIAEVGEFNKSKFKKVKLTAEDEKYYEHFTFISEEAVQKELSMALYKQDNPPALSEPAPQATDGLCCAIL